MPKGKGCASEKKKVHNRRTVAGTPRVLRYELLARVAVNVLGIGNACAFLGIERQDKIPKGSTLDDVALPDENVNGGCRDALRATPRAVGRADGGEAHEGERGSRDRTAHGLSWSEQQLAHVGIRKCQQQRKWQQRPLYVTPFSFHAS